MREIHRRFRDLYFKEGWSTAAAAKCGGCSAAWVKKLGGRKRGGGRPRAPVRPWPAQMASVGDTHRQRQRAS